MRKIKPFKLIAAILTCEGAGILGSIFTAGSIPGWYATLNKPAFNPPGWVFGPVWTLLYLLMGISLYLVLEKKSKSKRDGLFLFSIQLFLNLLWSIVFFGLHSIFGALMIIVVLWFSILLTIIAFRKISQPAANLLIPYLLWVTFASILNFYVFILN